MDCDTSAAVADFLHPTFETMGQAGGGRHRRAVNKQDKDR